jgi:hypothetical protein
MMRRGLRTSMILIIVSFLSAIIGIGVLAEVNYNVTHGDDKDDVVLMIIKTEEIDTLEDVGKSYLDIKTAKSVLEGDNVNFTLELWEPFRDEMNIRYEFQGWYLNKSEPLSMFDYVISYSNGMTNITFGNETSIDGTDYTRAQGKLISVTVPMMFFQNATNFNFLAQTVEQNPGEDRAYIDSTEPLGPITEDPTSWELILVFLIVVGVFGLFLLVKYRRKRKPDKNGCPHCGAAFDEEQDFCYSCGMDLK